jgi:DnaJ-class molecular chaperone
MSEHITCPRCEGSGVDPEDGDMNYEGTQFVFHTCSLCTGLEEITREAALDYVLSGE